MDTSKYHLILNFLTQAQGSSKSLGHLELVNVLAHGKWTHWITWELVRSCAQSQRDTMWLYYACSALGSHTRRSIVCWAPCPSNWAVFSNKQSPHWDVPLTEPERRPPPRLRELEQPHRPFTSTVNEATSNILFVSCSQISHTHTTVQLLSVDMYVQK